jgi:hypothetical protein
MAITCSTCVKMSRRRVSISARRSALRPARFRLAAVTALLSAAAAAAAPGSHLVADTTTPVLGLSGTLDNFGIPMFSGDVVAFTARRGTVGGIYADYFSGTPEVHKLVEVGDATPGGGTYTELFQPGGTSGDQPVAFLAAVTSQPSVPYSVYWVPGSTGAVQTVAASLYCGSDVDAIAVAGSSVVCFDTQQILELSPGVAPSVRLSTTNPVGGAGPFVFFPNFTSNPVAGIALIAEWTIGTNGETAMGIVYASPGSTTGMVLADTGTLVPSTTEMFMSFGQPALDGLGDIVFAGAGPTRSGIYRYTAGGLQVIVDSSMVDPVTNAKFAEFGSPVLDEGAVLFFGTAQGYGLLSTTLYRVQGNTLTALYSGWADVPFDDGQTRTISIGETSVRPAAIANHRLAVRTSYPHQSGSEAIVLLDVGSAGTDGGTGGPGEDAGTGHGEDAGAPPPTTGSSSGCGSGGQAAILPLSLTALAGMLSRRRAARSSHSPSS